MSYANESSTAKEQEKLVHICIEWDGKKVEETIKSVFVSHLKHANEIQKNSEKKLKEEKFQTLFEIIFMRWKWLDLGF